MDEQRQQLCADMGCNPEDLPEAMDDRVSGGEKGSEISMKWNTAGLY